MILKFCVVIPTYNNPATLAEVVDGCLSHTPFPILVVDDGSEQPAEQILNPQSRVRVIRFPSNRGKGVALQRAILDCVERGFTHMIAIDSDGQHPPEELPRLIEAALKSPWDLIIGEREWQGEDVPRVSKFGRRFSNFWVWYQTDCQVADTQSGLRVYPLFHVQSMTLLTKRFDFELEILVRFLWQGLRASSVKVNVFYPNAQERVSHFDKLWDNVRITLMNIVIIIVSLFRLHWQPGKLAGATVLGIFVGGATSHFGSMFLTLSALTFAFRLNGWVMLTAGLVGLYALPALGLTVWPATAVATAVASVIYGSTSFVRHSLQQRQHTWSGRMRGGRLGNWLIKQVSRCLGLRISYICMLAVVPYFYFFAPKARRASLQLFALVRPQAGFVKRRFYVIQHFYRFSTLLLDRLYQSLHSDIRFNTHSDGTENMLKVVNQDTGGVLVGAHYGALDIAARTMGKKGYTEKMMRSEFFAPTGVTIHKVLGKAKHSSKDLQSLPSDQQSLLHFRQLIMEGTSICLMGDRPMTNQYELVPFMGRLAAFDSTPFRVAALCQTTVHYCYGIKEGFRSYRFRATKPERLTFTPHRDKHLQLYDWTAAYARDLERVVRKAPSQWSNFYPFWSALPTSPRRDSLGIARYYIYEDLLLGTNYGRGDRVPSPKIIAGNSSLNTGVIPLS